MAKMSLEDWVEWKNSPQTKQVWDYFREVREGAKEHWACQGYVPNEPDCERMALANATALGALDNMNQTLALLDDRDVYPEFVEEKKSE